MGIKEHLKARHYRWAPEEVTLVEWEGIFPDGSVVEQRWIPSSEFIVNWTRTGRKVKGVIESE